MIKDVLRSLLQPPAQVSTEKIDHIIWTNKNPNVDPIIILDRLIKKTFTTDNCITIKYQRTPDERCPDTYVTYPAVKLAKSGQLSAK